MENDRMKDFAKQVWDARRMLDFAIAEGITVSDETITAISETEEHLLTVTSSYEEFVRFGKT
jgi:hypothetical protein